MVERPSYITNVFLEHRDAIVRMILRLSVKPEDVDDILQESLLRVFEADEKKKIRRPKSYLFKVSRNMVFRRRERRSREVLSEIDEASIDSRSVPADRDLHYRRMHDAFWEALSTLPQPHQRAILLRRVYGFSQKEVAGKMGVSVSSVEKYIAHGIKTCRRAMRRGGYDALGPQKASPSGRAKAQTSASPLIDPRR